MVRPGLFGRSLVVALLSTLVAALMLWNATQAEAAKGKKYALLVGVRDYDSAKLDPLKYTENDAEEMARVLTTSGGFTVRVLTTSRGEKRKADAPTAAILHAEIKKLLAGKTRHDTILVALSGHGIQAKFKEKEESFFCPANAQLNDADTLIALGKLFRDLDGCGAGVKLLLVDACRNEPSSGRNVDVDSLPRLPRGTAALFSCKSGERAFETAKRGKGHGVFFYHVLEGLRGEAKNKRGEVTWGGLVEYVTDKVSDDVPTLIGGGAKQTPELKVNLTGKSPVLIDPSKEGGKEFTNSIGMKLVRIEPGTFMMGSPTGEKDRSDDEGPQHEVEITKAFYMGVYTVTQKEFKAVMGYNPSYFSRDGEGKTGVEYKYGKPAGGKDKVPADTSKFPVENVSWEEAKEFCEKLTKDEKAKGREYRLPTEAEWEFACRAGTKTRFYTGDDEDDLKTAGWYSANSGGRTHTVGEKKANTWGLYDMHGNVYQWCNDWYGKDYYASRDKKDREGPNSGTSRVLRGGDWGYVARSCRAACRGYDAPGNRVSSIGFRVVCAAARTR